jgi:hypothetical protein
MHSAYQCTVHAHELLLVHLGGQGSVGRGPGALVRQPASTLVGPPARAGQTRPNPAPGQRPRLVRFVEHDADLVVVALQGVDDLPHLVGNILPDGRHREGRWGRPSAGCRAAGRGSARGGHLGAAQRAPPPRFCGGRVKPPQDRPAAPTSLKGSKSSRIMSERPANHWTASMKEYWRSGGAWVRGWKAGVRGCGGGRG